MFKVGDEIDSKYIVEKVYESQGGMGVVVFVIGKKTSEKKVLKYCLDTDKDLRNRFRREVRLLLEYKGTDFVVPVTGANLEFDPPYFVMERADSDLSSMIPALEGSLDQQEATFLRMVECIAYIHSKGHRHRDIKPQNFLRFQDRIVVSDLGLAKDPASDTVFTRSITIGGTAAFSPPQFFEHDGFRTAQETDDIFMLGKSFYYLLTGSNPQHIVKQKVNPVLLRVVEKCCASDRESRYQSCEELTAAIKAAFDILLNRKDGSVRFEELKKKLNSYNAITGSPRISLRECTEFFDLLQDEDEDVQVAFIEDLETGLVHKFVQLELPDEPVRRFLACYQKFLDHVFEQKYYPFGHAETVADQMALIFSSEAETEIKANAFRIALEISRRFNRSAALKTCGSMLESVSAGDDALAFAVVDVIQSHGETYLEECVNLGKCSHFFIVKTMKALKMKKESE